MQFRQDKKLLDMPSSFRFSFRKAGMPMAELEQVPSSLTSLHPPKMYCHITPLVLDFISFDKGPI
jgi:hypothetical protein